MTIKSAKMAHSIYHNLRNTKQYKAATGFTEEEFEYLFSFFTELYFPKQASIYENVKNPVLTDGREALFFILHYYKSYPTLQNLGLYFGFSESTASTYLERIKPLLKASYQASGIDIARLFSNQAAFDTAFEGIEDILVDVTEIN